MAKADNKSGTKWTLKEKITVAGIAVTVVLALIGIYIAKKNRAEDIQRQETIRQQELVRQQQKEWVDQQNKAAEEQRNRPYLRFVSGDNRPRNDGFTHLTFHNTSPTRNAVITGITLRVSDQTLLDKIAKYHPRVPPLTGAVPDKHEVRLVHGSWEHGFTAYNFYVYPEVYAEPDKPITLITCIVDAKLPAMDIAGEFNVMVSSGDSDTPNPLTLRNRQR